MAKNLMIRYVFEANPNGLRKIITKYGIAPARNPNDLWKKTNYIVMKFPQDALRDIVSIHPDRGIIMKLSGLEKSHDEKHITSENPISKEAIEKLQSTNVTPKVEVSVPTVEKKASACGCGCGGGDKTSGCDGGSCSCGGKCGGKKSNAEGDTKPSAPAVVVHTAPTVEHKNSLKENLPLIMIGVVAIAGFWLLHKNKMLPNLIK